MCNFCRYEEKFFYEAFSFANCSLNGCVNSTNEDFHFCPVCGDAMNITKIPKLDYCDFCLCGADKNVNYFQAEIWSRTERLMIAVSDGSAFYDKDGNKLPCVNFNFCSKCGRRIKC